MLRAIMSVCAVCVGLSSGCDGGGEEARKAAESARKTAEDAVAAKDKEIAGLKAEVAKLAAKPAEAPTPAAPAGGSLDPEIVRAAGTATGVTKLKLEVEADGAIRELSLYHNDAAALPAPVTALLEKQYPGAKIRAYETEFDRAHGRVFEVEVTTKDKQECEYSAKPDGTLIYNECHIAPKALSEAVRAAVTKTVPGAKITEAEKTTFADGREVISVEFEAAGKKHELYFEGDKVVRHELVFPAEIEVPAP